MEIDERKLDSLFGSIRSAMSKISSIDLWLPDILHREPLQLSGLETPEERRTREQHEAEMEALHVQMEEARQQTEHLRRQTRYLFWGVVFTAVTALIGIILQISPTLWGLLGEEQWVKVIVL